MASISPPSISNLKKSILKASPSPSPCPTPLSSLSAATSSHRHAHFPPPGEEPTARFSGVDYDRTPIVVLPNVCALPARGCPGKTYVIEEPTRSLPGIRGASVIPSATGNVHSHPHHHQQQQQQQQQPAQPTPIHHDMAKHLHPSKLRRVSHQLPTAGASLSHFESSSASESEDYDSFYSSSYTGGRQPVASMQVSFPGNGSPTAGTFAVERDRKTSTSSTATVTPTVAQHKGKLKKKRDSIGNNRVFSTTSESESDACLEGF